MLEFGVKILFYKKISLMHFCEAVSFLYLQNLREKMFIVSFVFQII